MGNRVKGFLAGSVSVVLGKLTVFQIYYPNDPCPGKRIVGFRNGEMAFSVAAS
jgi:hypothetical protein